MTNFLALGSEYLQSCSFQELVNDFSGTKFLLRLKIIKDMNDSFIKLDHIMWRCDFLMSLYIMMKSQYVFSEDSNSWMV